MSHARILFLESLATISGGQAVLVNMVKALQGPYDLVALLPGEGPLTQALRLSNVRCYSAPLGSYTLVRKTPRDVLYYGARLPWLTLRVWQIIHREKIDLVYANSGRTFAWGTLAATLAGRPILWHHHNLLADAKSLILLRLIGRLPAVRRILCGSEEARRQFPTLVQKAVVMHTGVDTQRFRPDLALGLSIRQELGIAPESRMVGIVGDLIPLKGQSTFIEAASIVHRQLPEARFGIVGQARPTAESRTYAAQLRQRAAGLPIDFVGYRADMPAVLNAFDALVIASTTETGPLVLLEALSCGTPVLSTPVGRAPELLSDGACGELFAIDNANGLAQKLIALLADRDRQRLMGHAARRRAHEQLSSDVFGTRILTEVTTALSNG